MKAFSVISDELRRFKEYIREEFKLIALANTLLFLVWLPWVQDMIPKIDTEVFINNPGATYNWLGEGRQGNILTKYIFGTIYYNAHLATLFGFLAICLAGVLFGYVFWRIGNSNRKISTFWGLICFSAPIMAEQFYFELQMFEISWAFVLCAIAVGTAFLAILKKDLASFCISVLCQIWCFSTYQIFLVVYVASVLCGFILLYRRTAWKEKSQEYNYSKIVLQLIAVWGIAEGLNLIITKIWFSGNNAYVSNQIKWGMEPIAVTLEKIIRHIARGVIGRGPFFTAFFGIFAVAVVITVIIQCVRNKERKQFVWYCLAAVALQITAFALLFMCGEVPSARTELVYPLVIACDCLILFEQFEKKLWKIVMVALTIGLCWTQISVTEKLLYTDEIRGQEDIILTTEIKTRIDLLDASQKPVVLVGEYQNKLNGAVQRGEIIGLSVYSMSCGVEPHYFWSSDRAWQVMKTMGFDFKIANREQVVAGRKLALDMPCWPDSGSVVDAGEFVVVKLSEDQWADEVQ